MIAPDAMKSMKKEEKMGPLAKAVVKAVGFC